MIPAETQVLQADDGRFEAMRAEDWSAFDAVLADELTYCHSTARLESKAEHVANLRARKPRYRNVSARERKVRIHGDVGLINGIADIHVENDGKENRFTVRYLAVYQKSGDAWRMLAWQSTRLPDA
jgi:ketosteroid isomerase-like protein